MQFDRLYNLILESILTQDIESKIKKAIQTLIKSGQLKDQNDPRVQQVKAIIKRNNSIDINGKTKLSDLLKQNQTLINRDKANTVEFLDSIPQFSQKTQYPNGVVIYRVQQSKKGKQAVRKIVDMQWGKDSNPWCLIARSQSNWSYWKNYNAYPKHIAFQNGQLLAFCANEQNQNLWWDRTDKPSKELKLLDGTTMTTDNYKWSRGEKIKNFIMINQLVLNKETGLYDSNSDIEITDKDLIDGHFPVKFGKVKGKFDCDDCISLTSLVGAPKKISGNFSCWHCPNLKSLQGASEYVGGDFDCKGCDNLRTLQGAPEKINGNFMCRECSSLQSLKGAPKEVGGYFYCYYCRNLKTLIGAPDYVGGEFICYHCPKLKVTDEDRKKYKING